ncbi:putative Formyl-coenzyme A transferase (Formyl-CoA transferase; carnitine dehydratase) [Bradyrhizobium sp. ORS 278]|uniref:CaiB/BaiF CoA transferase family protein n=1 Tax=Bradyrhizobium sp. (strain ORS 278) TaxID=114615 RepID=UPI0001507F7A|nr:CoA transferase [Bradyrhizobium sp. ORS 278]CAL78994.1 putative Formyl-coenzyme A transferase (Formyl-CoA transferase; carnitine dehydratase) [Bradyrhizobium sp. ORS 278]
MPIQVALQDRNPRPADAPAALAGLLVIDFTRVVAGPACTQTLADFGAEVIKIEQPIKGDDTRAYEHAELGGESAAFLSLNRNKQGMVLDLTTPEARNIARALIAKADVVVENFSSHVMEKHGLDYPTVSSANPSLIYCSISAYGRTGPFAWRSGFDPITQAESGFMSLNGFPDGPPVRTGPPIVDFATGMSACNAILLALAARQRLGRGQHVEVALFDTALALTGFSGMAYLMSGVNPTRTGNSPNDSPTVGVFEASDGPLYVACANDRLYHRLVAEVLERPDLLSDPRFATRKARWSNRAQLRGILADIFAAKQMEVWISRMNDAGVPVGRVRTVAQAFGAPEVRERNRICRIPHMTAGAVPNIEPAISMQMTPAVTPRAAPRLGEHTATVLRDRLGYSEQEIEALRDRGAFGPDAPAIQGQPTDK